MNRDPSDGVIHKFEVLAKGRLPVDATRYDIRNGRFVLFPKHDVVDTQINNRIQLIMDRTSESKPVVEINARIAELRKAMLSAEPDAQKEITEQIHLLKDEVLRIVKREMKQNYPFDERKGQKYKKWNWLTNQAFHVRERVI